MPNDKSVTELEIMHGALNGSMLPRRSIVLMGAFESSDIAGAVHSLFYMRSESSDIPVIGGGDNPVRLKALKEKVKQSNLPLRFYGNPDEVRRPGGSRSTAGGWRRTPRRGRRTSGSSGRCSAR